jgi:hypothetical protein
MRYKISFLVFKVKKFWPVLDSLASYFFLILSTVVLLYALYQSLAIIWGLLLFVFMLQTVLSSNVHYKYRQQ